jgi:uncharacterized protein (DUF58 family)
MSVVAAGWVPLGIWAWVAGGQFAFVQVLYGMALLAPAAIWVFHRRWVRQLSIQALLTRPFHENQSGSLIVEVANGNAHDIHEATLMCFDKEGDRSGPHWTQSLLAGRVTQVRIPIAAGMLRRGRHRIGQVSLRTGFPFNLFLSTIQEDKDTSVMVYPAIESPAPDWPTLHQQMRRKARSGEEIISHRDYRPGDDRRAVDWKLSARRGEFVVREFDEPVRGELVFRLQDVKDLPLELGLRRLTAWVVRADLERRRYSLELGDTQVPAGEGQAHRTQCLVQLALFGSKP